MGSLLHLGHAMSESWSHHHHPRGHYHWFFYIWNQWRITCPWRKSILHHPSIFHYFLKEVSVRLCLVALSLAKSERRVRLSGHETPWKQRCSDLLSTRSWEPGSIVVILLAGAGWLESLNLRRPLKILTRFGQRKRPLVTCWQREILNIPLWLPVNFRCQIIGSQRRTLTACGKGWTAEGPASMIPGSWGNVLSLNHKPSAGSVCLCKEVVTSYSIETELAALGTLCLWVLLSWLVASSEKTGG